MIRTALTACIALVAVAEHAVADASESTLAVYPPQVHLHDAADFQRLVVRQTAPDGLTRDVTAEAEYRWSPPDVATIATGFVQPTSNGTTTLLVRVGEQEVTLPVAVTGVQQERPISFQRDVLPALTKAGCNTGDCHGSARGQDGFHLSLFGYDPAGDYQRITRELPGRRINLALPAESLLLQKATGSVPHTGGALFDADSRHYATVIGWLRAGAPRDPQDTPLVTGIEIFPPTVSVLPVADGMQQTLVRAHYADGTDRDVTHLATFMSSNAPAATVAADGRVTAVARGESQVLARFDAYTVGTPIIVTPTDAPLPEFSPTDHYVDQRINAKLKRLRIAPSPVCSDEIFVRRVYLDIVGQLPTVAEYEAFMKSDAPAKRTRLVDELLERKAFIELWVMKWAERLQMRSTPEVSYKAMLRYYTWLQQRLANDVPMDQIVRDLLTAEGGTFSAPATNYYELERDTLKLAENTAQVFMGPRLQCAQCHNHPFDRWTMDDYYGFAAFFAQVGRKDAEDPRERIVYNRGRGEVKHPVDGRVMPPTYLGGGRADLRGRDRRVVFAEWLTADDNPFFAHNLANFVWAHFFGRGIIEPVDDVRVSNPPSNPELLDALAQRLIAYDYDLARLVRDICTSEAYQRATRSTPSNAGDSRNFARAPIRRLRAEILLDIITQVTETADKFRGLPAGARAVQIADGNTTNYFLTTFGRTERETACTCEITVDPNLSQSLHLINGRTVHQKIHAGGVVQRLLEAEQAPTEIIRQLYLRCLSRPPTEKEQAALSKAVNDADDRKTALEDVFWALLNSKEFVCNR